MPGKQKKTTTNQQKPLPEEEARGKKAGSRYIPGWTPIAVLIFTALLYARGIFNGFVCFDDEDYILKNPFLKDLSWHGVKAIFTSYYSSNYHPLTTLAYLFEYNWFGVNPLPYHALNVLLHLVNTWLVFKLAEQLSGKKVTALIVCVLFAIHPMHVESVAWVSELKDVLYAAFYVSSLLLYLRYMTSGFRAKYYNGMLLLFIASMLSKSAAVTLPVLLVAIDLYKGRSFDTRFVVEKIPLLLLSLIFGIVNIYAQRSGGPVLVLTESVGFVNGTFLIFSAVAAYIMRIIPFSLSAMHYFPMIHNGALPWKYYLSLPFLLFISWLVIRRSAFRKELLFGFSFFLIAVSVMLQIVSVGSALIAERYTYIAYIGVFYIIGQWVAGVGPERLRSIGTVVFSLAVVILSAQTWNRISVWKDSNILCTDIIEKNPGILDVNFVYLLRGNARTSDGDLKGAMEDYTQAIIMNPQFAFEYSAYYCRGHVYDMTGNIKAAIQDYTNSIQLKPDIAEVFNNRGWDLFQSGNANAAMQDFNKAISLDTGYAEAYNNRGWIFYQSGDTKSALTDFSKTISLKPGFDKPYYNRSEIRLKNADFEGAIEDFNSILKLHPNDDRVYYQRGNAMLNINNLAGACSDWKRAVDLGNNDAVRMMQQYCH